MAENAPLFAVVDIETTGFSPLVGDRIIELGIVRVDGDGSTVDEYVTLVNPLRDIGPTHVHGITQEDVEHAPLFTEVVGDVLARLAGVIFSSVTTRGTTVTSSPPSSPQPGSSSRRSRRFARSNSATGSIPSSATTGSRPVVRPPESTTRTRTPRSTTRA